MIIGASFVGSQVSMTALQISSAKSSSVPVKLSGEYSSMILPGKFFARSLTHFVPCTAIALISSRSMPNTTSLCSVDVEL